VLDVALDEDEARSAVLAWRAEARRILDAVGWEDEHALSRTFPGGATLAISAPLDVLLSATDVNEWAWDAAMRAVRGQEAASIEEAAESLREEIAAERNDRLLAVAEAARARGLSCLHDGREVSVGLGAGSITWAADGIPEVAEIPWDRLHDVPVVLVTGTNGKTTTVRLVAAMLRRAGRVVGTSSTDGVHVDREAIATGDYSGPEGARKTLRDTRVEAAVLETARGGILRRGLPVLRAKAAIVTNVAEDHLGEFGIHDVASLADVKMVVARAVHEDGLLVLNAEDPILVDRSAKVAAPIGWFGLDPASLLLESHIGKGGSAAVLEGGDLVLHREGARTAVVRAEEMPFALGGAARYNVANALGAILLGSALDLPAATMADALREFRSTPEENPGRANVFDLGGVRVLLDFAHNPHGMRAFLDAAFALDAKRRLVLIGQAGDRDDASIRELARIAWEHRPDRVILKEMEKYRRGRAVGEIPGMMEEELLRAGARPDQIEHAASEVDAVRRALRWSRPGDLLVLTIHANRDEVLSLLGELSDARWSPGADVSVRDG
jgi:cyanophycin synthetase